MAAIPKDTPSGVTYPEPRRLEGDSFVVELHGDGTATVRVRPSNTPVEITSTAASHIDQRVRRVVDELASDAAQQPAPWNGRRY